MGRRRRTGLRIGWLALRLWGRRHRTWLFIVWLALGLLVAATHGRLAVLTTPSGLVAAILTVLLWPVVLVDPHIVF